MSKRTAESRIGELISQTSGSIMHVVVSIFQRPERKGSGSPFGAAPWDDERLSKDEIERIEAALASPERPVPWDQVKAEAEARRSA